MKKKEDGAGCPLRMLGWEWRERARSQSERPFNTRILLTGPITQVKRLTGSTERCVVGEASRNSVIQGTHFIFFLNFNPNTCFSFEIDSVRGDGVVVHDHKDSFQ